MNTLDRYILREYVKGFFAILAVFALMLLLKEVLSTLTTILTKTPDTKTHLAYFVVLFFLNKLPAEVLQIVPVTAILAMMFAVGSMAKRKEILAIHASGISYVRTARPLLFATGAIALGVFLFNELLVPGCEARARYVQKVEIEGRSESVVTHDKNITTKGAGNRFYDMKSFDVERKIMKFPTIVDYSEDGRTIVDRVDATSGVLIVANADAATTATASPNGIGGAQAAGNLGVGEKETRNYWRFFNVARRSFDENGNMKYEFIPVLEIPMELNLDRFLVTNKRPDEMNLLELRDYIAVQEQNRSEASFARLRTELHLKIAFPIAAFLLGTIGYTFAVRASIRSLVMEFGLALMSVVGYYVLLAVGTKAGGEGGLPPLFAAWMPNLVFVALTFWRFRALEHVPRG